LWEGYNIEDVATPEAWRRNPELVQRFYNERRQGVMEAAPNAAHRSLADLQKYFDVQIITQNIDDLHERAGSVNVLHLHGVITRSQSEFDPAITYPINGWEIKAGCVNMDCSCGRMSCGLGRPCLTCRLQRVSVQMPIYLLS
jgi:NAD-dependent deacetylase